MCTKLLSLALIFLLASCSVGKNYKPPQTLLDTRHSFVNGDKQGDEKQANMNAWWERIGDPTLQEHIELLLNQNLQLIDAAERIIQAREKANISGADYYPSIGASADRTRSFSPNTANPSERSYLTSYNAGFDASWQLDLFGKISRSTEQANAAFQASRYDREALIHTLIAELLNRRVAISVNQRLLNLAEQNTGNRQQIYTLVKQRYERGAKATTLADVYLAEENLANVTADKSTFKRRLTDEMYRLDILLGRLPGTTYFDAENFPMLPASHEVPLCLPVHLLDRRPDLKAAELRIKAANASIGIAIGDLYPTLSLGGSLGVTANRSSNLFSAENLVGSLLSSITLRLYEGGKIRGNIRLRESEMRALAATYAEDVLNAVREVESALNAEQTLAAEVTANQRSVKALIQAEELSKQRYILGIFSLQDFLNTQQRRYNTQLILLAKQQQKWRARIALYLALGGDWFESQTNKQPLKSCPLGRK